LWIRSVCGNPLYWRLHGKKSYSYRYTDEDLEDLNEMPYDVAADYKRLPVANIAGQGCSDSHRVEPSS
jgi:uncharacterized protein YecE (DUF72 family)